MGAGTVPIKTPAGLAELGTRALGVSQRHRTVLFLVDGKRSAADVLSMALQAGVPGNCFDELLEQGLIMLSEPTLQLWAAPAAQAPLAHVDVRLPGPDSVMAMSDSVLPASRSLYPSVSTDSALGEALPDGWNPGAGPAPQPGPASAVAEARDILLRAVRSEAPLSGSLTVLRLRRVRTRADLESLLDEVESRISKPPRTLAATQTMRRVRELLNESTA